MDRTEISTPFGRRTMSLAQLAGQRSAAACPADTHAHKWKLFRAACEAKDRLGLSERALSVLNALLTFHPGEALAADGNLVVFPSNRELSLRAHGMAPATLRRHLAQLVERGILARRDSPNGKRYARRGSEGISEAFGFDLRPLLARAAEIVTLAGEVAAARLALKRLREEVSLLRRDAAKLIETGLEEGVPGDWMRLQHELAAIVRQIPRQQTWDSLYPVRGELALFVAGILKLLETDNNQHKTSTSESQDERHIQNSNPNPPFESEPRFEKSAGPNAEPPETAFDEQQPNDGQVEGTEGERAKRKMTSSLERLADFGPQGRAQPGNMKAYPLGLVLQACPEITFFAKAGISNWRDLMAAAVTVRSSLGISASAYEDAAHVMGQENAAVVVAAILERGAFINSPGGYLRALTEKARAGHFSLGPVLMALLNAKGEGGRLARSVA